MGGEQKDIVQKMDALLRSLIDYPSVSKQVDEYNRASFKEWRTSLGTKYNNTIANLRWWMDWQKNPEGNQAKIDQWLQSVPET
jgi:arylsulfatase K